MNNSFSDLKIKKNCQLEKDKRLTNEDVVAFCVSIKKSFFRNCFVFNEFPAKIYILNLFVLHQNIIKDYFLYHL